MRTRHLSRVGFSLIAGACSSVASAQLVWQKTFTTDANDVTQFETAGGNIMLGSVTNNQLPVTTVDNGTNAYTPDKAGAPLSGTTDTTTTVTGMNAFSGLYNFDWTNLNPNDETNISYELAGFLGTAVPQTRQVMGTILRHWYVPAAQATSGTPQGYYASIDLAFGSVGIVDFGYHASPGFFMGNALPTATMQLAVGFDPTTNTLSAGLFDASGNTIGANSLVVSRESGMYGAHPPAYDSDANIQSELNNFSAKYLGWEDYTGNGNDIPTTWNVNSLSYFNTANGAFNAAVVTAPLTWNNTGGTGDGATWDTTSQNWNSGSAATYHDGANVVFSDANNSHYAVTLNATVSPGSIVVNNSAGNYTISGTGSIAGTASLTKSGTSNLTLDTVNTYSGGTTVATGTLVVGASGALPSGAVNITGGTLQLAASTGQTTMTSLAISGGGVLDVNNNHVIINYGSGADPIATIASMLATGYNGGAWNGAGGIISTAAAANSGSYGLGYADFADAGNPAGLLSGTIEVAYTLLGDADLNHSVNGVDFGILAANFNKGVSRWDAGDFNYDNAVNGVDFGLLAANFNKGASGASASDFAALDAFAAANGLLADVPEPTSILLCAVGGTALLARRRRSTS
jgi:autotransporter-associated beta strand protein